MKNKDYILASDFTFKEVWNMYQKWKKESGLPDRAEYQFDCWFAQEYKNENPFVFKNGDPYGLAKFIPPANLCSSNEIGW